jgi:hypothetical protein
MDELLYQISEQANNSKIVIMPISRLLVEEPVSIGEIEVLPPGYVDLNFYNPVDNQDLPIKSDVRQLTTLSGQSLREVTTSLTGFSIDILNSSPLVAFIVDLDWDCFLNSTHNDDVELLRYLSAKAERAFDLVRFYCCRLDLPDTLPGIVGSWDESESGSYLGAMIYNPEHRKSHLIAGSVLTCAVVKGIGLELDFYLHDSFLRASDGEVAGAIIHALSLLSDAMYTGNDTIKFIRTMTLIEFLASPYEYKSWKKLKGNIACHCVSSKEEYLDVLVRFEQLTSIKESDVQKGYRTLIVHQGKFIEELIPNGEDRRKLFRELQKYCTSVLRDMIANQTLSWDEFITYRATLKNRLGV